jgi:CBS domain-containing protein/anti-sigma regulatory factor (Ser/Thr protein kinase)
MLSELSVAAAEGVELLERPEEPAVESKVGGGLSGRELTKVQELVYELKIGEVMTREVVTIGPEQTIAELDELLRVNGIAGVPVLADGNLVGIVSVQDLIRALKAGALQEPVARWMTANVITLRQDESVIEAVRAFARYRVGRLPVVDDEGRVVGIVTGGDITRGLLRALELGYHAEEVSRYRASHIFEDIESDETSLRLRYFIAPRDFARGGEASRKIKRALQRLGGHPSLVRRVVIVAYEAEMNIVIHSDRGGELLVEVNPERVHVVATDDGPGIEDVQLAMTPGFSTAPDWIKEMGFGAGMGLPNIQRWADEFKIESKPGWGTRLDIVVKAGRERALGRGPAERNVR